MIISTFSLPALAADFGIKVGLNMSNPTITALPGLSPSSKTDYTFGAYMIFDITDQFSIQPEILYSRKGFDLKTAGTVVSSINAAYIDIPVNFHYKMTEQFGVYAGPFLGLIVDKSETGATGVADDLGTVDYGLAAGLSADINQFNVDIRWSTGLIDINRSVPEIKSSVISFLVGYSFY